MKTLASAREVKKRDVSIDTEQEVVVLSTDTTEQQGFHTFSTKRAGRRRWEVSEGIFGQRSELRNVLDGSSSDDCGNGDGNGHQGL